MGLRTKDGIHLEFVSEPGFELALGNMENRKKGIRLVNVRERKVGNQEVSLATVFVPRGALAVLEEKIEQYRAELTKTKQPRHKRWAAPIAEIRHAALREFWTDAPERFPAHSRSVWWEVWLSDQHSLDDFKRTVAKLGMVSGERFLSFPERRVLLVYGTVEQLGLSVEVVDSIAELRQPREVPAAYREMMPQEMKEWAEDLLARIERPSSDAPAICILDTGINRQHPLLEAFLDERDLHAVRESWGTDDHQGHGTEMAGLALYEDLAGALASSGPVAVPAVLESAKILPRGEGETNDPELWGSITQQAVARVEIERPHRKRCHLMAVSATESRDQGRPSSWSGAVDQLAAGVGDGRQRLVILSAGNERDRERWRSYPEHLATAEIHDPGQSWNALTVGAFTERWEIDEADFREYQPLAPPGDLAPMTSTSMTWQHRWPLKPDVVLEGGNAARGPSGIIDTLDSLSLLTTYYRPIERLFTLTGDTSAASALAAHLLGHLQARYPEFWPETLRALLVHSARWTGAMLDRFGPLERSNAFRALLRSCGYGVPSLDRALWSARSRLCLVVQEEIQPFSAGSSSKLNEMHLHDLPWPRQELEALGDVQVELRVTLSYFVEPSPGERGWQTRYRYASHGLRFDVRPTHESEEEFRKRINKKARDEDDTERRRGDHAGWDLGPTLRHRGSLHSDTWHGTAADLATREQVAVYPVGGWWKERPHLGRSGSRTRYALVVSIEAPEIEVDLYTPVAVQVGIPIEIPI